MRTEEPTAPPDGAIAVIYGVKVKVGPVTTFPEIVTETEPVLAPSGTEATMLVSLQLVTPAGMPLKLTELLPCVAPNLNPDTVTTVLTGPDVGDIPETDGVTVNVTELEV